MLQELEYLGLCRLNRLSPLDILGAPYWTNVFITDAFLKASLLHLAIETQPSVSRVSSH